MADTFKFELVSPERLLFSADATAVVLPGSEGEMTVMANHAPTMTAVRPGVVTVTAADGAATRFVVFGGFADIMQTACTLLAESASPVSDLDRGEMERRLEAARAEVTEARDDQARTRATQRLDHLTSLQATLAA